MVLRCIFKLYYYNFSKNSSNQDKFFVKLIYCPWYARIHNWFKTDFEYLLEKHLQRTQPGSGDYLDLPSDAEEKDEPWSKECQIYINTYITMKEWLD